MSAAPPRRVLLGAAAATALLLRTAPRPAVALRELAHAGSASDPAAPLVALVALVAWALAAWLLLTGLVTAAAHLPGAAGLVSAVVARRLAPAAVRRAVEVALGLTVAVGVLGASPAAASSGPAAGPAAAPSLDWSATPGPTTPLAIPSSGPAPAEVVVRPGDSLWALAEQDLTARREATPTDADVAQAWPGWWAANREVIGDDPDLLQPGTALTRPPADGVAPAGPASS